MSFNPTRSIPSSSGQTGQSSIKINQAIWLRSAGTDQQYIFRSIRDALMERGVTVLTINGADDTDGFKKIRKAVWASDAHVITDGLLPCEMRKLRPVFEHRKNFSVALVDWWTSDYWFTRNADYLIFRNYNGIAARRGQTKFIESRTPPLLARPANFNRYNLACAALRLPALLAAPVLELQQYRQRQAEQIRPERLLYFPFTLMEKHVPLKTVPEHYDFSNVSGTGGYWTMRDPFASAWLNYGNLYYDRVRITDLIHQCAGHRVFDLRRSHYLNWDEYCQVVRASRFAIATGGLHQNSVAKYTEFACLGTPMIGEEIPFEFPWLKDCLYPVDTLKITRDKLKPQLQEALELQPRLRNNCLNLRETLLKLYHPHRVLDMLQTQADGQPIPPGYLKPTANNLFGTP
jgi:hypothetical protein